ncbi:hypothetical protein GCM10009554_69050 [Kribbella koreensis]|uniref:DUF1707 domain-containing protein n=1 Tax=Kribbella koreensis TaxID=57909 RepID=A0ABP4C1Z4_9ACTN
MNEEKPVRIGDQEREEAVSRLGAHYEAGRLTAEEHQERVGEALQAKTQVELAALFADLPGEPTAGAQEAGDGEQWAGPWGWSRPPWTTPQDQGAAHAAGQGAGPGGRPGAGQDPRRQGAWSGRDGAQYGPPWGGRGPLGRVPLPLLVVLAVAGVLASIGCVVFGGHPPVLPLVLLVAGVVIAKRRRQERRA